MEEVGTVYLFYPGKDCESGLEGVKSVWLPSNRDEADRMETADFSGSGVSTTFKKRGLTFRISLGQTDRHESKGPCARACARVRVRARVNSFAQSISRSRYQALGNGNAAVRSPAPWSRRPGGGDRG